MARKDYLAALSYDELLQHHAAVRTAFRTALEQRVPSRASTELAMELASTLAELALREGDQLSLLDEWPLTSDNDRR